jgi:hypothetical protein
MRKGEERAEGERGQRGREGKEREGKGERKTYAILKKGKKGA